MLSRHHFRSITGIFSTALLLSTGGNANANWGAELPQDKHRPDLAWHERFAETPDVIASGSIEAAIGQCDAIVGSNKYCVVGVDSKSGSEPFGIYRSRTRVLGLADAAPVIAQADTASVYIPGNVRFISVENLELTGVDAGDKWTAAIEIYGENVRNVLIRNNRIHRFTSRRYANGIIVSGTANTLENRIARITIDNNTFQDMQTGSGESIAINGNVTQWVVSNNTIERVNNIAIDAIGGEGIVEPVLKNGRIAPHRYDAARIGWIEDNTITDMSTKDNPAYGNQRSWAAAIYIDGGRRISVTGNQVFNTPWAFDLGAENCVTTHNITMRYNTASGSYFGDLRIGGYAAGGYAERDSMINCDPTETVDGEEGHGNVRELTIAENLLDSTNASVGNVFIEFRTTRAIVAQDGVEPVRAGGSGNASGDGNAIRIAE